MREVKLIGGLRRRLKPYPAYKDSGVDWLGEVPARWDVKKVKRLCLVRRGASPRPIDDPIYFDDEGEYSWVRIADVTASERYLEATMQRLSSLGRLRSVALEPDELFVSIAATVGKPIITKIKACIHDGFVYFVGLREDREYLYYLFSCGEPYKGLGKLGTQLNLNTDTFGDIYLPRPSREEQHTIVEFLDGETARIDALIAKKERLIELLHEKRAALIERTVSSEADERRIRLGYKVELLPGYAFPSAGFSQNPAHIRLLRGVNVGIGTIRWDDTVYWSGSDAAEFHQYQLRKGDLVLGMDRPWIGRGIRVAEVSDEDVPSLLLQRVARLRAKSGLLQTYLRLVLSSPQFHAYFAPILTGISVPHVSPDQILSYRLSLPSLNVQESRIRSVSVEMSKMEALRKKLETSIVRLNELRTSIISAAVTGKIDVRDFVAGKSAFESIASIQ